MRLENVWLRYARRGQWALRGVDAAVEPGTAVVVAGRNGAGKSTLLQVAAGVLRPTRGAVRDRPVVVGWVPERFPAHQPLDLREYLTAMGRLRGLSRRAAEAAERGWSERLGLAPYRGVRLPALSKGTAQKVGLAQALLVPPGLLVLDEPWEGLDADARDLVPELVAEVRAAGGSVLVSDHRGETARLPGAARWTVAEGALAAAPAPATGWVVEVGVPGPDPAGAVAALRAAGHEVLRVRRAAG
ncbi:MAG TPA: ATP-binding cassette domain-containing protein [Pilimelia sp.]|nr:ATP-binding cassette domain-containing protein [Pilimelia sp.]